MMMFGETPFCALDRRALLRNAILAVAGSSAGAALALPTTAAPGAAFFSAGERATLDSICDTVIPRTDSPGAIDAGVPAFLEKLMAKWANPVSQAQMRGVVDRLGRGAVANGGAMLTAMTPDARLAYLSAQDAALIAAKDTAYLRFKHLLLTGYYYSEAGATKELRYELIPGVWEPAMPLTPETRAWAA